MWRFLRIIFLVALISSISFLIATYFFAVPLALILFFLTPEGASFSQLFAHGLPIYIFPWVEVMIPWYLNVGDLFILLEIIFLVCLLVAWKGPRESFTKVVKESLLNGARSLLKNCLFTLPIFSGMALSATIFIQRFQESHGVPTGSITFHDPFEALFILTYTSVIEEVGFRLIPLGLLLVIYVFWATRSKVGPLSREARVKLALITILYPEAAKERLELRNVRTNGISGISAPEWVALLLTSTLFGLAHYFSGWGPGKITSTLVTGLIFGLSYLIYGAEAPIILHWFFNGYGTTYGLAAGFYPGQFDFFLDLVYFMIISLGILGWFALVVFALWRVVRGLHRLWKKTYLKPVEVLPP